jgi:serine/threonine protein kinase
MLICQNVVEETGKKCDTQNRDEAKNCKKCGASLYYALKIHAPGDIIQTYRIIRLIGHGGFGAVHEAEDTAANNQQVAIKETVDPSAIRGFSREFAMLHTIQHDHLPGYFSMFEKEDKGYLVMEMIPGQNLEDVLNHQHRPLPVSLVQSYALQICDTLQYLHQQEKPVIHRDIKPANIRITPEGLLKLVDFGLFKQGLDTTVLSQRALTPTYAPIEQWGYGQEHTDPRSDIYSLGATLYHLLSGHPPPTAIARLNYDSLQHLADLKQTIPPHIIESVMKAMSLSQKDRYDDVMMFKHALMGFSITPSSTSETIPAPQMQKMTVACPRCGYQNDPDDIFCQNPHGCGYRLHEQNRFCQSCGHTIPVQARFCSRCGSSTP